MKSNGDFKIGDEVQIKYKCYHNSKHKWYDRTRNRSLNKGEKYIIEDIDNSEEGLYLGRPTLKIGGNAFGAIGVRLTTIKKPPVNLNYIIEHLDEKIEAMERRITNGH